MDIIKKYAFVLVLILAVIYVYAPPTLEDVATLPWLSDINIILNKSLAYTKREAGPSRVDPIAAANVDEDLDYRIAHRMKSAEGWRSFLTGHPDGPHAQSARAELEKLVPAGKSPVPAAAQAPVPIAGQASDVRPLDTKAPSEAASPAQPSPPSEVAKLATDEICKHDENGLQWLSNSPTSDEALRFLAELRCEKSRPEIFRLTEHLDYRDPAPSLLLKVVLRRSPKRRLQIGERLSLAISRAGVWLRAALSQGDVRLGGRPPVYRRSLWRFSARRGETRLPFNISESAADPVAAALAV